MSFAAGASAASSVSVVGTTLNITAAAGKTNDMTLTTTPAGATVHDNGDTLNSGGACTGDNTNTLTCAIAGFSSWFVTLDDMGDTFTVTGPVGGSVGGGADNDHLNGGAGLFAASGGSGEDVLTAGSGPSILHGDLGEDRLVGGPNGDNLFGDGGHDTVSGNGGSDVADGGAPGVDADVIDLGSGDDALSGLASGTNANLGDGDDVVLDLVGPDSAGSVDGGPGVDTVGIADAQNTSPATSTIDLLAGTALISNPVLSNSIRGFENVYATPSGGGSVTGTEGSNSIQTGISPSVLLSITGIGIPPTINGPDTVNPRGGSDVVSTGAANDVIATADGYIDSVDCGAGTDTVSADQFDLLANCEKVTRTHVRAAIADTRKPVCSFTKAAKTAKASSFAKAYAATFKCDEDTSVIGQILMTLKNKRGKAVLAKAGQVVVAEASTSGKAGIAKKVTLRVSKKLRKLLPKKYTATVQFTARDEFGNPTTITRKVRVSTPRKRKKK